MNDHRPITVRFLPMASALLRALHEETGRPFTALASEAVLYHALHFKDQLPVPNLKLEKEPAQDVHF